MTTTPPEPAPFATREALAGLAAEVDNLKHSVDPLRRVPGQLENLADRVEALTMQVEAFVERAGPAAIPSWLLLDADYATALDTLAGLVGWLDAVFLRYRDGAEALPDCWLWHPDVVEELLVCQHLWQAAYRDKTSCVDRAADWHDRYRPALIARLQPVRACSLERHTTPTAPVGTPLVNAVATMASWWAAARYQPAPAPGPDDFAAADARARGWNPPTHAENYRTT